MCSSKILQSYVDLCNLPYRKCRESVRKLEVKGVIEKVKFFDWAAPIVPVIKQDGTIKIGVHTYIDYKLMVNKIAKPDVYSLFKIDYLFAA